MTHFEKNIAVLRRHNPALAARLETVPGGGIALETARNGEPTAKVGDIYLHSPYNPSREAEEWAKSQAAQFPADQPLTVLGFGLGHHLRTLAAAGHGGTVIEPNTEIVRTALEGSDLAEVLDRFELFVGVPMDLIRRRHDALLTRNLVSHPASLRANPESLAKLQRYAEGLNLAAGGGKLKILVVNPIYGGSLPTAHHCIRALRNLGHQVITFESEAFAKGMEFAKTFAYNQSKKSFNAGLASFLSQAIELRARETRPDMVLALAQAPIMPETMVKLERRGIPTAFWFVEDYRVLTYWQENAPYCSYFFGIQKENFAAELARIGMDRYAYLPTCAAADVHRPVELTAEERKELGSPLSFIGAGYFNRQVFFKGLSDYPFKIWGSDWRVLYPLAPLIQRNAARIDTETCVKIFNASEINLNLHSSTTSEGVVPDGDFVNPRTFEIACCGAFQLVDRRTLLPGLFEPDELETFSSLEEVREKIDRYLTDADGRMALAERGRQRVLAEHTYERRMEELVATMLAEFPATAQRVRSRAEKLESIMAELDSHEGLEELLQRLPDRQWFGLNDVMGVVATGKGKLSRAEKIFLMLQNVEVLWEAIPE